MNVFVTKKNIKDVKGTTIPEGTTVFIIKEKIIMNPETQQLEKWAIIKIDNGTNEQGLMPETAIKITDEIKKQLKKRK